MSLQSVSLRPLIPAVSHGCSIASVTLHRMPSAISLARMSQLLPIEKLSGRTVSELREQASLRRSAVDRLVERTRAAASPGTLIDALRAHSVELVELGLHDDAARLNAFARAVATDANRLLAEASELESRLEALDVPSK